MAGLRIGYAIGHRDTISQDGGLGRRRRRSTCSACSGRACGAELPEPTSVKDEQKRNTEARAFTQKWFADRGYTPTDSQTNFMFVDIKRPARGFREACAKQGVLVGRDFPPYEKTHCRISIGTMDEMQRAVKVFEQALAKPAAAA